MITATSVSARGAAEPGRGRTTLDAVTLQAGSGVLAILGAYKDGTALLFDLFDGSVSPRRGTIQVVGGRPDQVRPQIARVSLEAPLPDALLVSEVCELACDLRGEPRRSPRATLAVLGVEALERRRVRTLSLEERRTVTFALALGSTKVQVLLVEEPLVALVPQAPRLVVDALRASTVPCVVVATASLRDAVRLADQVGLLTAGKYEPFDAKLAHGGPASVRVLVGTHADAAALSAILSADEALSRVETSPFEVVVHGPEHAALAAAVTRAIAAARIDVERIESSTTPLEALREALAASVIA